VVIYTERARPIGRAAAAIVLVGVTGLAALPSAAQTSGPARLRASGPVSVDGLRVLAGSLHDHTTDSDGDAASADVAAYVRAHHDELAMDFLSLTEHSDFFPATPSTAGPNPWQRSRSVTDANTVEDFTMLRGFEWTNDQQNHLNVIESANWNQRFLGGEPALVMTPFWEWLATEPTTGDNAGTGTGLGGADGVGQFNHPSSKGALNWDDYAFHAGAADVMATIEVRENARGWYWFALSKGWTVGPVMNADYHPWQASGVLANPTPGAGCGANTFYDCERSLVLASANTRAAIVDALKARRTAASDRPDLWATLRGPGGAWMGSTVNAAPGETVVLDVEAGTEKSALAKVEIVRDGVVSDFTHYYGANKSCLNGSCSQHTPSYLEQQRRYEASGGMTTKKGPVDEPPAGTKGAPVALDGLRDSVSVAVSVPTTASTRPDGKHFFYAIVTRADGSRVLTAPVFTSPDAQPVVPEAPSAVLLPVVALLLAAGAWSVTRRRAA
jgi:hypothetical protein